MRIGIMNHPANDLLFEIDFVVKNRFDFIDLTLEPPGALLSESEASRLAGVIRNEAIDVVGHTAWYLPVDSPFPAIRRTVRDEIVRQLDISAILGIKKITIHHLFSYPHRFFSFHEKMGIWTESLAEITAQASQRGIDVMLEHGPCTSDNLRFYLELMRRVPETWFHLDVGHANLGVSANATRELLKRLKKRLIHVHLSDNLGGSDDLHLPLGAGKIPWISVLSEIHKTGYNDTFTLEVFSACRDYLLASREKLREWWRDICEGVKRNE